MENPSLHLKENNVMMIINSGRFKSGEQPIMLFKTDLSGIFNPNIMVQNGTLRWVVNGVEQIANSPSYDLTGNIDDLDVKVYANDVAEGESVTGVNGVNFSTRGIIGTLDFAHFKMDGCNMSLQDNPDLEGVLFSTFANVLSASSSSFNVREDDLPSVDFTNVTLQGVDFVNNNNLAAVEFGNNAHNLLKFLFTGTAIASLDVKNSTITAPLKLENTPIVNFALGANVHTFSEIDFQNCINLLSFEVGVSLLATNTDVDLDNCNSLANFGFGTNPASELRNLDFDNCKELPGLDVSIINGDISTIEGNFCDKFASFIFGAIPRTINFVSVQSWDQINFNDINMSSITISNTISLRNNASLTLINLFAITIGLNGINLSGNALLDPTINGLIAYIKAFYTTNTPIKNVSLTLNGGTNVIPSAQSLQDIEDTKVLFTDEGFVLTSAVNS